MSCPDAAGKGASASRSDDPQPLRTLPKAAKLRARRQYLETYEQGRRASGKTLVVFGRPSPTGEPRLGITVTRKYGGAVARNLIKRRLREVFRIRRASLALPLDLVVNVREGAGRLAIAELEKDFLEAVERLVRWYRP